MSSNSQLTIGGVSISPKAMFLADSAGALLSTIFLFVIARFFSGFGMPPTIVYFLAGIAFMLYLYSLICYFFMVERWKPYLLLTIAGNVLYSFLTVYLVIHFFHVLSPLGVGYFVLEIIVLYFLVYIEYRTWAAGK